MCAKDRRRAINEGRGVVLERRNRHLADGVAMPSTRALLRDGAGFIRIVKDET